MSKKFSQRLVAYLPTLLKLAIIPLILFDIGKILYSDLAYVHGLYTNYYQIRIRLITILSFLLLIIDWQNSTGTIVKNKFFIGFCLILMANNLIFWDYLAPVRVFKSAELIITLLGLLISLRFYLSKVKGDLKLEKIKLIVLSLAILSASLLGIGQFLLQGPINFWFFYKIGQPPLDLNLANIAFIETIPGLSFTQNHILRAYGATPHPNILGGMLVISGFLLLYLVRKTRIRNSESSLAPLRRGIQWLAIVALISGQIALIFTFSKTAIFAEIIGLLIALILIKWPKATRFITEKVVTPIKLSLISIIGWLVGGLIMLMPVNFLYNSFNQRAELLQAGINLVTSRVSNLIVGVGYYSFIYQSLTSNILPRSSILINQPIHNLGFQVWTEFGTFGGLFLLLSTLIFSWQFLLSNHKASKNYKAFIFLLVIILTILGSFDHYLWI